MKIRVYSGPHTLKEDKSRNKGQLAIQNNLKRGQPLKRLGSKRFHCVCQQGFYLVGKEERYLSVVKVILEDGLDDLEHGGDPRPPRYQSYIPCFPHLLWLAGKLHPVKGRGGKVRCCKIFIQKQT